MAGPLATVLAFGLLAAACGGGAAPAGGSAGKGAAPAKSATGSAAPSQAMPTTLKQLIAVARQEGTINVTTPASAGGGSGMAHAIVALIASRYGVHLQLNFTPGPPMPTMTARLIQEYQAHQAASSDIWMGASTHIYPAIKAGMLRTIPWQDYAPVLKTLSTTNRNLVDVKGQALAIYDQIPSITYNTKLVPKNEVPHKLTDILKPWWKGKIATTIYAAYINDLGANSMWGAAKTLAFEKRLLAQKPALTRCGQDNKIASGQYVALALDCASFYAQQYAAKGAPMGFVIPTDAAMVDDVYLGVPKTAPHWAAAALYMATFISRQGQAELWKEYHSDNDLLPGSHSAALLKAVEAKGAKIQRLGYAFEVAHPEVNTVNRQLQQLIKGAK